MTTTWSQPRPKYTFQQARVILANEARKSFTHEELSTILMDYGISELPPTHRGLAMRYAWVLLPGKVKR